jgi:hypothetical protein
MPNSLLCLTLERCSSVLYTDCIEDLSTKVSQFDEQKNTIINDTRNSLLNIGEGTQLNIENL